MIIYKKKAKEISDFTGSRLQHSLRSAEAHGHSLFDFHSASLYLSPINCFNEILFTSTWCAAYVCRSCHRYDKLHHRVKNTMQVISSLLNLQSSTLENTATMVICQESQDRVNAKIV
ncbi:MAG: histidine kinase dimerization/phosphoacceptor domain -containing protein [Bacteroidota bacterium]